MGSAGLLGPQRVPGGTQYSQSWLDSSVALASSQGKHSFLPPPRDVGGPRAARPGEEPAGLGGGPRIWLLRTAAGGGLGWGPSLPAEASF